MVSSNNPITSSSISPPSIIKSVPGIFLSGACGSQKKPDFFVIHLVSSLPLVLLILFNFQTKFILRISGYPHLTFMRRLLWKIAFKKIYAVTCPTELTKEKLLKSNLINKEKLYVLYDPIIDVHKTSKLKNINLSMLNII